ncbi:glycosyltransferase [Gordonia sp. PKS22-38]|uniref:Glycosyltransferase n=1 Tax=Gordonia prachuapensis TaxID=3115651 RepID=A0ABU7MYK5_9ACTN|nr:glycosyltransferase [Gordonia sp. PKS22-38]
MHAHDEDPGSTGSDQITELFPILAAEDAGPLDPGARWVGEIQIGDRLADEVSLRGGEGYTRARLLVRDGTSVRGFVDVGVEGGAVLGREVRREASRLPVATTAVPAASASAALPVSVVVCTRDRTPEVARVVDSLLAMDHPLFEVVIVDNAASSLDTWRYVDTHHDPRVRVIHASVPGLAAARNRGLEAARHDIVAFTDDDVVVDRHWLSCLTRSFADPAVGCVTGLVPAAQLRTTSQVVFEQRVGWSSSLARRAYRLSDRDEHGALFPFRVADYGTGANFAVRRSAAFELGGFDEALGAGSPTRGGEDIDWFVRTLVGGHTLVFDPDAITWHQHREDDAALLSQAHGYGLGLGAWLTKVALDRRLAPLALSRSGIALRHLLTSVGARSAGADERPEGAAPMSGPGTTRARAANHDTVSGAGREEISGLLGGPRALLTARAQGRKAAPFRSFAPRMPVVAAVDAQGGPSSSQ